jgi:hypothetical protein
MPETSWSDGLAVVHITYKNYMISTLLRGRGELGSKIPLLGSSRRTRLTTIPSSRSVNHPLGRNQVLVCTAEAGIKKNDAKPRRSVTSPSIKNNHLWGLATSRLNKVKQTHLQPAIPLCPSRWKIPNAASDVAIPVTLKAVQKKLRRVGSSRDV